MCLYQISISDYVVFDQGSLFQTLLQATQSVATVTRAPVERVVAFLSQYSQCQPSLVSANASGVWVASGRNQLHLARGSLVGQWRPDDFSILQYCAVYYHAVLCISAISFLFLFIRNFLAECCSQRNCLRHQVDLHHFFSCTSQRR